MSALDAKSGFGDSEDEDAQWPPDASGFWARRRLYQAPSLAKRRRRPAAAEEEGGSSSRRGDRAPGPSPACVRARGLAGRRRASSRGRAGGASRAGAVRAPPFGGPPSRGVCPAAPLAPTTRPAPLHFALGRDQPKQCKLSSRALLCRTPRDSASVRRFAVAASARRIRLHVRARRPAEKQVHSIDCESV